MLHLPAQEAGEEYDHVQPRCTDFCLSIATARNRPHPGSDGVKHQSHTLVVRQIRSFEWTVVICRFCQSPRQIFLRGRLSSGRNQTKTGQEVRAQGSEIQMLKMSHPSCEESKFYSVKLPLKFSIPFFLPAFLNRFPLIIFFLFLTWKTPPRPVVSDSFSAVLLQWVVYAAEAAVTCWMCGGRPAKP